MTPERGTGRKRWSRSSQPVGCKSPVTAEGGAARFLAGTEKWNQVRRDLGAASRNDSASAPFDRTTHTGVPIPSFGAAGGGAGGSGEKAPPLPEGMNGAVIKDRLRSEAAAGVEGTGGGDPLLRSLLLVEAALTVRLRRRTSSSAPSSKVGKRVFAIGLDDLYSIARECGATSMLTSAPALSEEDDVDEAGRGEEPSTDMKLEAEERVLAALAVVGSPDLYRLTAVGDGEGAENGAVAMLEYVGDKSPSGGGRTNRIEALRRQYWERRPMILARAAVLAGEDVMTERARRLILSHRCRRSGSLPPSSTAGADIMKEKKTAASVLASVSRRDEDIAPSPAASRAGGGGGGRIIEPYLHPGMTLEERIRARAEHSVSRRHRCSRREVASSSGGGKAGGEEAMTSPAVLVRFADALRSLVRGRGSRISAFGGKFRAGSSCKVSPAASALPLSEAISSLSGAVRIVGAAKIAGLRANGGVSVTAGGGRRAGAMVVARVVADLARAAPGWVRIADRRREGNGSARGGGGDGSRTLPSKDAVIVVRNDVDYHAVRAALWTRVPSPPSAASPAVPSLSSSSFCDSCDRRHGHSVRRRIERSARGGTAPRSAACVGARKSEAATSEAGEWSAPTKKQHSAADRPISPPLFSLDDDDNEKDDNGALTLSLKSPEKGIARVDHAGSSSQRRIRIGAPPPRRRSAPSGPARVSLAAEESSAAVVTASVGGPTPKRPRLEGGKPTASSAVSSFDDIREGPPCRPPVVASAVDAAAAARASFDHSRSGWGGRAWNPCDDGESGGWGHQEEGCGYTCSQSDRDDHGIVENRILCINKYFTDSDADGGEVARPSSMTSPRGLKRLFSQLNAGKRI